MVMRTMASLSLPDAFAKFGAKADKLRTLSAVAGDGSVVLKCAVPRFVRPSRGVLRYEDRLSRDPSDARGNQLLGEHLTLAQNDSLPVRMVVVADATNSRGRPERNIHVRTDLVGKVTMFDGDHFIVDFKKVA
jgi:hypothetical protein